MRKQSAAMWTAGALTGALLLGACGGGGGGEDKGGGAKGEIAGADKASKSASPSASSDKIKRPEIKLAPDAENVFEKTETGDPAKDAVLADNQRRINSIDQVITRRKNLEAMKFYARGSLLVENMKYAKGYLDGGISWAGKTRFYNQKVELDGKSTAQVSYCIDESKSRTKVTKTGKLKPNNGGDKNYVLDTVQLKRNKQGVWQGVNGESEPGGKKCPH
ncbi:lipoprotein [Streptomyces albiaxialis]|uniref:Lipoprotein n=1 Tax=Streptomyces albiaxialis TaxID=329523 RepID=A0ABP5IRI5_9ACTN